MGKAVKRMKGIGLQAPVHAERFFFLAGGGEGRVRGEARPSAFAVATPTFPSVHALASLINK